MEVELIRQTIILFFGISGLYYWINKVFELRLRINIRKIRKQKEEKPDKASIRQRIEG